MISKTFPATHPRKGEQTFFKHKILLGQGIDTDNVTKWIVDKKRHTIRGNYDLWKKRADKINKGEAVLSLRQWTGSPYNSKQDGSKQVEFLRLTKLNIQKVDMTIFPLESERIRTKNYLVFGYVRVDGKQIFNYYDLSKNDGLNSDDFLSWFGHGDHKNMAMLHFNENFKY